MDVTGKWEFEVAPGKQRLARSWVEQMERRYEREIGPIYALAGSAAENGFALDNSVGGLFRPATGAIYLFYAEEKNLACRAEELAHYFQYKRQGLIGKTEEQIGRKTIDRNERGIREIMLRHGFRVRR